MRSQPTNLFEAELTERRRRLTPAELAITRMLAERVRRGHTLIEISRSTRIAKKLLAALARHAKIRYKHQHPTAEQQKAAVRAVVVEGLTFRAAATQVGMSRSAVHRLVQRQRNKQVDSAGDFRVEARHWRCPIHGKITVYPCVACAAIASATSE